MSLKPHLKCFTNPYYIYIKCFCTMISCEWVYGTTLSLIPPLSLGSIFRNLGVGTDLSDVVTSKMSLKPHLECFTNPYYVYKKCFCTLISCEWVYGTTLSLILSLGSIFRNLGVGTDLSDEVTSWLSPKPHLECFTNYNYIESISDKVGTDQSDVVTSCWATNPTWSAPQIHIIYIWIIFSPW
jgi:hypothetical protein